MSHATGTHVSRRQWVWLVVLVLVGVAVRVVYVLDSSADPLFAVPIIDARSNLDDARQLLAHGWLGPDAPFWKPPMYAYVLAAVLRAGGDAVWAPRFVHIGLDAGSCVLVFLIGRRLFGARVALAAVAVTALCATLIFSSGELVSASLSVFVDLLAVHLLLWARSAPGRRRWLVAGVVAGAACLVRAEMLLFVPVLAVAAWRRHGVRSAILAVVGAAAAIAPVTARNAIVGHDAVLISANGGINLFVGTEPR
jgi:4-amino-4-deoxy-L-arabinose transferase-like glycosyltransferase